MVLTYSTQRITSSSSNTRSVFYCFNTPEFKWDLNNTTLSWILVVIFYIASPATVLLNTLVIVAVKQKKELRRNSNILLSSMAVAGLLMGVINMPLRATVDAFILSQLWIQHICLLDFLTFYMNYCVVFSSLYHLTAIAWERYIAIVKWMEYKVVVTRKRLTNLAIIAWSTSVLTVLPVSITRGFGMNIEIVETLYIVWLVCATVALTGMTYFYVKVYLGIRTRRISQISQVAILVKAKLESRVAKTTVLLTATVIFSMSPAMVFYILGEVFPTIHTVVSFRLWEAPVMLYSLANPILYCYRDRRFRKAVLELLRIRKPRATVSSDATVRYLKRKYPIDVLELQNVTIGKSASRLLTRAASCDLARVPESLHRRSRTIMWKRSLSAPTLDKCNGWFNGLQLQQHSSP